VLLNFYFIRHLSTLFLFLYCYNHLESEVIILDKDFNDFMNQCDNKDWSNVIEDIGKKIDSKDPITKFIQVNLEFNLAVLREYHDWLNS